MKKKLLLTGGNGFIGRNLRESFLAEKYDITAPGSLQLNLADTEAVDGFFRNKEFDVVVHGAVKPGHRNAKDLSGLFYTNVRFFENLRRHKDSYGKFINLGSGAAYGMDFYKPKMKEEYFGEHIPADEHGFSKYIINRFIEREKNFVDLRILGVYGKYEDYGIRFISNMICKALFNLPLTMKQNRKFDYIRAEDLPAALEFFIENDVKHKAYNITPDKAVFLLDIAEKVKEAVNKNAEIVVKTEGLGPEYSADNARIKAEFAAYKPASLDRGIAELAAWYKENMAKIDRACLTEDK